MLKARHAARVTGLPAIADDSGLVVDALGGAPGVRSARFAGEQADDGANIAKLLALLAQPSLDRTRSLSLRAGRARASRRRRTADRSRARGAERSRARRAARGGFGYDPVFFDPTLRCTAAELEPAQKNRVSHRGMALRRLGRTPEESISWRAPQRRFEPGFIHTPLGLTSKQACCAPFSWIEATIARNLLKFIGTRCLIVF